MMRGDGDLGTSFSFKGQLLKVDGNPFTNEFQYGVGAVLVGCKCLMFGGYSGGGSKHRIYIYDRVQKAWTTTLPKNERNGRFGSIRLIFIVDDVLYALTWNDTIKGHDFMALDLVSMGEWVSVGTTECPNTGFGTNGSYIEKRKEGIVFGGESRRTDIFVYNVDRSSWYSPKVSGKPPVARRNHAACSTGQEMYVLGGERFRAGNYPIASSLDLHVLTMRGSRFTWSTPVTSGPDMQGRYLFPAVCASGRIFAYGGMSGHKCFSIYSIKQRRWYRASSDEADEQKGGVHLTTDLPAGNGNSALLVVDNKLLVLGGNRLKARTPMEISPC